MEKWSEDANFIKMTDGTILFFQPSLREELRSLMDGKSLELTGLFQSYKPSTKESAIEKLNATVNNGSLKIGRWTANKTEIDRLALSPDLSRVKDYCAALFPGPKGLSGVSGYSVVRLKGTQFLITGGGANKITPTKASEAIESTATILDTATGEVIKTFPLRQRHRLHMSILLNDGRVLLLGTYGTRTIEIVDPDAGTSRILSCQFDKWRWCYTACMDRQGNCIVIGGFDKGDPADRNGLATRLVEKIDVANETITRLPDLVSRRCFMSAGSIYSVEQNALTLADGSILVSAGLKKFQTPMGKERNLTAEILNLQAEPK